MTAMAILLLVVLCPPALFGVAMLGDLWRHRRLRRAWDRHVTAALVQGNGSRWGAGPVPVEDRPEWAAR